jgi:Type I phosphodiesterase / nucleotide pyrophosphatase
VSVIVLLADGARPDTLAEAMDRGQLPALARLRDEGGLWTITSCFPSVTGPAYAPFLMGRFPGDIGLPGLRWFDRSRTTCTFPDYTRSYVGHQMRELDRDLDPEAPTIFERCRSTLGALSVIGRGLDSHDRVGSLSLRSALRAAATHFRGDVRGWLAIDRDVSREVVERVSHERPEYVFAAFTGVDKASHAEGHDSRLVRDALAIVDATAAQIRAGAEARGDWREMHLWISSDHGHSPVREHEDLARFIASVGNGLRVVAHPWVFVRNPDVAVMVSGNAMAHVYLELERTVRPFWRALNERWEHLVGALVARPSVDLVLLPSSETTTLVRTRERGTAEVKRTRDHYSYRPIDGDPLGIGAELNCASADDAHDATRDTDYPDSVVQIAHLAGAARSGDVILSAARDWDFRARYEPIPHRSSHGALHREHMLVPLLMSQRPNLTPRRTTDLMPSALTALRSELPACLNGESFF